MFCLDTNIVIGVMSGRLPMAANRLQEEINGSVRVLVPSIVIYELRFGIARSARRAANERALDLFLAPLETPSFEVNDAVEAADIRAGLHHRGTPIGPYDILIAAQARRRGAALVTANLREFRRVPGLLVQDWSAE
jgi:tRNA(fMet)-specific endonuclease VapC